MAVADPDFTAANPVFLTAEAILSSAQRALDQFGDATRSIDSYVSLAEPPADCCNLLTVYANDYGPDAKSLALEARSATPTQIPMFTETRFTVALWESCYPTVDASGGSIKLPEPTKLHEINRIIYQHGFAVFTGVNLDYRRGDLFLDPRQCPRLMFGKMRPLNQGGCAGWTYDIVGSLDG